MRKLILIIMVCTIIMPILSSCYDAWEVDDITHIIVMGIDKGISDKWRLTLQFSSLKEASGGGGEMASGGEQSGFEHITVDAPSFFTGIDMLNSSISRKITFLHTHLIVISEELARDGIIGEFIAPIIRFREIRRSAHIVVTKGSSLEFIKENAPLIGTTLSKTLQAIAKESEETGFFPHVTLADFYNDIKSTSSQPIVTMAAVNDFKTFKEKGPKWGDEFKSGGDYLVGELPRHGKNKLESWGTALFEQDRMVGELTGTETRKLLMIRGDFKRGFFTIQDPKQPNLIIPLDIRQAKKPHVTVSFDEDKPIIGLTIHLEGDLLAVQSRLHYEVDPLLSLLEETVTKDIENKVNKLIDKCKKLNVDVFKFGDVAARKFWTIDEWEKYNWNNHFKDAEVTTKVEFEIKRTGTQIKSSPIPGQEEGE